jgi:hypothetical protein
MKMEFVDCNTRLFEESAVVEVRQTAVSGLMVLNSSRQLPKVILTSCSARSLPSTLDCWNQNRQENADDPDDDKCLNKRDSDASRSHDVAFAHRCMQSISLL